MNPAETTTSAEEATGARAASESVAPDTETEAGQVPGALEARGLSVGYQDRVVVEELDLVIPRGQVTVVVGPNACGKSTLLRSMSRLLRPRTGQVLLEGEAIHRMPARQVARQLGLLPQTPVAPEGISVSDLVGRGRHPHLGMFGRWSAEDDEAVAAALDATNTGALADRSVDELSGGQRQRVWIALALAQRTGVLLLDEPTTYLDVSHQVEVLDLLLDLNQREGTTVVMVLHDLNLAARYADHLVAMADGQVVAEGSPQAVMTPQTVRRLFGIDSQVMVDPVSGTPLMVPIGRHHRPAGEAA
ncbi:iron complex transport system ATP-binding protein [Kytococcus aerolatus]|uniref:Iron complex transport system ATP-binding protein n=1 Tax=Kytococcus aerolatus TaxID=592308 RepID=A0A212TZH5_9MICO|nr:iron complex transport system ATP-binding protein [Kytococcus aerolatus]